MSFMKPQRFADLSPTDIFYDTVQHDGSAFGKKQVWMKLEDEQNRNFNVISQDGTKLSKFDDDKTVEVIRKRVHILDLRQGDQCSMTTFMGIGYMTNTVLKVEYVGDSRHVTFIRPMICADGFGTTCPSGKVHTEKYTASVSLKNTKSDDYYHLVGIDYSAIYDNYSLVLSPAGCADRHRMATFMQMMGDKRSLSEILCMDGLKINSECIGLLMNNYIKVRELPPEYPDRDDRSEAKYIDELREKANPTKWDKKYLGMVDASREKLG